MNYIIAQGDDMKNRRMRQSYKTRKFRLIKLYIIISLVFCATAGIYYSADHALGPVLEDIAKIRVKETIAEIINQAVTEALDETTQEKFLQIEKDDSGYISAISANTLYMNKFSSTITSSIHEKLKNTIIDNVKIPIGSIIGSNILSQTGPNINLKVAPVGNTIIDFSTEIESAGINQTKYKVYMKITGKAKPIIPFVSDTYEITSVVPVAETVIVGNVPNTFLSLPSELN